MIKRQYFIAGESLDAEGNLLMSHFRVFYTRSLFQVSASKLLDDMGEDFLRGAPEGAVGVRFLAFNRV